MRLMAFLAGIHQNDLSVLFVLVGLVCLVGAGYLFYVRNVAGGLGLLLVAAIALVLGT